jgi:selenocysteine-specific elongation factor
LVIERLAERIEATLRKLHQRNPLRLTLDRKSLLSKFHYVDETLFSLVLDQMRDAGTLRLEERGVALAGEGPKLSQNEQKLYRQLLETFRTAGMETPSVKQCQQQADRSQQSVPKLLSLAAANGDLVQVAGGYYLHAEVDREIRETLRETFENTQKGMTLSEIRERLGTSRKYAVPYCEYLDRTGFTRREGDLRYLA